jgi:hypothetical protein
MNAKQMSDSYFQGLGLSAGKVNAAWNAVKKYGDAQLYSTGGEGLVLAKFFSPAHRQKVVEIGEAYIKEELAKVDAAIALEDAIASETRRAEVWRDDEALSEVDAYAIVFSDCVKVTANQTGMGDRIPKAGRKYIGDRQNWVWRFPLSALPEIKSCKAISFVLNEKGDRV